MAANQSRENVPMATGQINDWNPDRGFGFLESDGRRVFLHAKDFAEHYKAPEVGDRVNFKMGVDKQGRPCAQKAVHVNEGGRITSEALFLLAFLVGAPICALIRLARIIPGSVLARKDNANLRRGCICSNSWAAGPARLSPNAISGTSARRRPIRLFSG